jgi:hypothetical protein
MAIGPRNRDHFLLQGIGTNELYTSPRTPRSGLPPGRVRAQHAAKILGELQQAVGAAHQNLAARDAEIAEGEPGFYLQFDVPADYQEALDSLEHRGKAIELVAVSRIADDAAIVSATVFVPEADADYFTEKVTRYRDENTTSGRPKNEKLVASVAAVRLAAVRALFTDANELFPLDDGQVVWWEIWARSGRLGTLQVVTGRLNIPISPHPVSFAERDVVLVQANVLSLSRLIDNCDAVAELRIAKDTPSQFLEMGALEQADWAGNLVARIVPPTPVAPAICILDSGVTQGHPLIAPGLAVEDQHTNDAGWGVGDSAFWNGHGTLMAGVALYGDMQAALLTGEQIALRHRLESVKILDPQGLGDAKLYGAVTETGIRRAEDAAPNRRRVFCLATSSQIGLDRGRPTSWSAAIDKLSYGGGDVRRLLVLAVGNIRDDIQPAAYPDTNDLADAESPSQAWNALTVGAYTDKSNILSPGFDGWQVVAAPGDLGPTSRTSTIWDRQWPLRPDVVFEGGNHAHDGINPSEAIDDLQLISTYYRPTNRLFQHFGDTSAATALAANLAAQVMAARPELWPETVRGLIVHSAEWTPAMRGHLDAAANQTQKTSLVRRYGWGVPHLSRALKSASNDATLMVEDALLPFRKDQSAIKTRDMHLHQLPWPKEELLDIGDQDVELRVTLSYFIEPNPGERGWTRRHRYASHSLRFEVKRALESVDNFRARINRAAEVEEDDLIVGGGGADHWVLGGRVRNGGSIHSDIWRGSAAELAERDAIGIYPISGWWKEKPNLQRWDRSARYALLVSIRAPDAEVDLYNAIANKLAVEVPA